MPQQPLGEPRSNSPDALARHVAAVSGGGGGGGGTGAPAPAKNPSARTDPAVEARQRAYEARQRAREYAKNVPRPAARAQSVQPGLADDQGAGQGTGMAYGGHAPRSEAEALEARLGMIAAANADAAVAASNYRPSYAAAGGFGSASGVGPQRQGEVGGAMQPRKAASGGPSAKPSKASALHALEDEHERMRNEIDSIRRELAHI